jgi:hypothetical protein
MIFSTVSIVTRISTTLLKKETQISYIKTKSSQRISNISYYIYIMEPLKSILELYEGDEEIQEALLRYLPERTKGHLHNHIYVDYSDIYLKEYITCIKKSTGLKELSGTTHKVTEETMLLKIGCKNIYVKPPNYYFFKKIRKQKKNPRDFYMALLDNLWVSRYLRRVTGITGITVLGMGAIHAFEGGAECLSPVRGTCRALACTQDKGVFLGIHRFPALIWVRTCPWTRMEMDVMSVLVILETLVAYEAPPMISATDVITSFGFHGLDPAMGTLFEGTIAIIFLETLTYRA